MNCPDCGAELIYHDFYGYLALHQSGEKLGDIYKCPNYEGFPSEEEALNYQKKTYTDKECKVDWEMIVCASNINNGFFYTDKQDELHEGYPC